MSEYFCNQSDSAVNSLPIYSIPLISNLVNLSASDFVQTISSNQILNEFNCLLEDSNGVELFRRFLDKERAAHYLYFWFACQGFKTAENEKVYQLIKVIYRAYIRSESQSAVALQPNTKKNIVDKLSSKQCLDKSIFDNAQLEIRNILIADFYQRFIKSDSFKLYQQNLLYSDQSKSSENTDSLKEREPSYVECCAINSALQSVKCKKDKSDFFCKASRGKSGGNGNSNKDRRSLAESDPILFVQQVSSKLEKFHLMQQCGLSNNPEHRVYADMTEVLVEDDAESILDNHCSYLMAKDSYKGTNVAMTTSKNDGDLRSLLSHDSGVATNSDLHSYSRLPQQSTYHHPSFSPQPQCYQLSPQYRHHHTHDHHHFRTRRRNHSEEQSVFSLEEQSSAQVPYVTRKGKSQASDASSIFDSGVSSTYEQSCHPWMVANDSRVSHWISTNPAIATTPVELAAHVQRSCSAQTPGYKDSSLQCSGGGGGGSEEVWIDSCCPDSESSAQQARAEPVAMVVGYYWCGDPVPYRTQVPCSGEGPPAVTLGQFKQLLPKRGLYRYFFKRACDEFEGGGAVQEEYTRDEAVLPLWQGKVVAKVERAEPG